MVLAMRCAYAPVLIQILTLFDARSRYLSAPLAYATPEVFFFLIFAPTYILCPLFDILLSRRSSYANMTIPFGHLPYRRFVCIYAAVLFSPFLFFFPFFPLSFIFDHYVSSIFYLWLIPSLVAPSYLTAVLEALSHSVA